jgi:ABC-type oligopeptide transport system ATPase subunit
MYLGKLCEVGPAEAVYRQLLHPYTKALLFSVPRRRERQSHPVDPRRASVARSPAERMPVPHPLPPR